MKAAPFITILARGSLREAVISALFTPVSFQFFGRMTTSARIPPATAYISHATIIDPA